jgi:hypothetical protein
MCDEQYYPWTPDANDFAFIAASRNAAPDLLAENERMRELLKDALEAYDDDEDFTYASAYERIREFLAEHP